MEENSTLVFEGTPELRDWLTVMLSSIAMCVIAVLTVIGNIFVIVAVFTYKPLRIVPNFFIVSLATADMTAALLVMPFHISVNIYNRWLFGGILCDIWLTFDILICTSSILNICVIALDRYWAIHDPIRYAQKRTVKRVLIMIMLAWVASAVVSVPPLFGWSDSGKSLYDPVAMACQLTTEKGYVIYSACGSFFIPLCIMTFVYLKIYSATKKRLRQKTNAAASKLADLKNARSYLTVPTTDHGCTSDIDASSRCDHDTDSLHCNGVGGGGSTPLTAKRNNNGSKPRNSVQTFFEEKQRISLSKERKAARTLAIIMITFVVCWLPFFVLYITIPFVTSYRTNTIVVVEVVFVWLGYVNSTLNPIIYTVFNAEFKKAFNEMICRRFCRRNRRQRSNV